MLILARKAGQEIRIDERIVITVLEIHGNRMRLGIDAPPDVLIRRSELPPEPAGRRCGPVELTAH